MQNRRIASGKVSKKTPKANAAAEAKKGANAIALGGKKVQRSRLTRSGRSKDKRKVGRTLESEVENEKDDEKVKIVYVLSCSSLTSSR